MGKGSSGEELLLKIRKPYTITKQRERWTEEEHNSFLEAVKLYGRAWQRIQEHIGTKTAVQIRSHAQKFFSKLEKEALLKGVPLGHANGIDILPPRPKRKPKNPYPRKRSGITVAEAKDEKSSYLLSSLSSTLKVSEMEDDMPREKHTTTEILQRKILSSEQGSVSEVLRLSLNSNSCGLKEYAPVVKKVKQKASVEENDYTDSLSADQPALDCRKTERCYDPLRRSIQENNLIVKKETKRGFQMYSKPVQFEARSSSECKNEDDSNGKKLASELGDDKLQSTGKPIMLSQGSTTRPESHTTRSSSFNVPMLPLPSYQPPQQLPDHQDSSFSSLPHIQSTFSSLILTFLLQNPAVHAAASLAASFWPLEKLDLATNLSTPVAQNVEKVLKDPTNTPPSLEAIAVATVAAASAWWAAHGLLPFLPVNAVFSLAPTAATLFPLENLEKISDIKKGNNPVEENNPVVKNPDLSGSAIEIPSCAKSPILTFSPSESDESETVQKDHSSTRLNELKNIENVKFNKKTGRSSCGSNTPSGSEVEVTIGYQEHERPNNEENLPNPTTYVGETIHRSRATRFGSGSMGDPWKEVSEEGRLAFQALFAREVLPQSFSPPPPRIGDGEAMKVLPPTLKESSTEETNYLGGFCVDEVIKIDNKSLGKSSVLNELNHGKLKASRTGFKPYRRCSVEAKGSKGEVPTKEKSNKRIRLEGEASTT